MTESVLDLLKWKIVQLLYLVLLDHIVAVFQMKVSAHVLNII